MWKITANDAEVLGVHAALLPTGHIIYFTGNEYSIDEQTETQFEHTRLYHCDTDQVLPVSSPSRTDDVFCCGHAMLPDGDLLIAGGTEHLTAAGHEEPGPHSTVFHVPGIRKAFIFDFQTLRWAPASDMAIGPPRPEDPQYPPPNPNQTGGRWYPTLVTLPSGKVMAFGGHPGSADKRHNNNVVELYSPASNSWSQDAMLNHWSQDPVLNQAADIFGNRPAVPRVHGEEIDAAYYPRLHVLPSGDVFCSTLLMDDNGKADWRIYQPPQGSSQGQWISTNTRHQIINELDQNYGNVNNNYRTSAVLLPLLPEKGYQASVLLCGSNLGLLITPQQTNFGQWKINVARTRERGLEGERRECNAIILPTGQVFVCGGVNPTLPAASASGPTSTAAIPRAFLYPPTATEVPDRFGVLKAELYSPESNSWQTLEPAAVVRNYHSVALLMPDGRVWTAGSSIDGEHSGKWRPEIEVYSPWYYGRPDRPEITEVSRGALSSDTLLIKTPQDDIQRVAILRTGSVTHCFNSDQRYIGLNFRRDSDGVLLAQIPSTNIAIPGYYLLFLIDSNGVPSKGEFIYVSHSQFNEPKQGILFSLLQGIFGILPSGQVKREPPGDPPFRDMLLGLAVYELATNVEDAQERVALQKASLNLVSNIARKTLDRI